MSRAENILRLNPCLWATDRQNSSMNSCENISAIRVSDGFHIGSLDSIANLLKKTSKKVAVITDFDGVFMSYPFLGHIRKNAQKALAQIFRLANEITIGTNRPFGIGLNKLKEHIGKINKREGRTKASLITRSQGAKNFDELIPNAYKNNDMVIVIGSALLVEGKAIKKYLENHPIPQGKEFIFVSTGHLLI